MSLKGRGNLCGFGFGAGYSGRSRGIEECNLGVVCRLLEPLMRMLPEEDAPPERPCPIEEWLPSMMPFVDERSGETDCRSRYGFGSQREDSEKRKLRSVFQSKIIEDFAEQLRV